MFPHHLVKMPSRVAPPTSNVAVSCILYFNKYPYLHPPGGLCSGTLHLCLPIWNLTARSSWFNNNQNEKYLLCLSRFWFTTFSRYFRLELHESTRVWCKMVKCTNNWFWMNLRFWKWRNFDTTSNCWYGMNPVITKDWRIPVSVKTASKPRLESQVSVFSVVILVWDGTCRVFCSGKTESLE